MEVNSVSSLSNEKQSSEHSTSTNVEHTSTNVEHMNTEKEKSTSVFVNHEQMEVNSVSSLSNEKQSSEHSTSTNVEHMNTEKEKSTSVFVNHAAIAWHESRRKWIGDQSCQPQRTTKDPIIGWSKTYEDLLSTHEPFSEPIPLSEMVDFLVDIWLDEGLFG